MSSVFISNVDDYLAPSQACVNPMFATTTTDDASSKQQQHQPNASSSTQHENVEASAVVAVVPRRRRGRGRRRVVENHHQHQTPSVLIPLSLTPAPQVTMADCLACSGCVTTAETVLVEQHSLQTLEQTLCDNDDAITICMTISPASWADLARKLGQSSLTMTLKRKVTTYLQRKCRARIVLDGRVPLEWSLQEAAHEFCHNYNVRQQQQQQQQQTSSSIPPPTVALSSTKIQHMNGTVQECASRPESRLPLLSSSCPALVCLVEKSTAAAVPHLSTTKSPMAMAGSFFKESQSSNDGHYYYHVAIMPCHDKKLEASRRDLQTNDNNNDNSNTRPLVDLVITTSELWTLLCTSANSNDANHVFQYVQNLEMANVSTSLHQEWTKKDFTGLLTFEHGEKQMNVDPHSDDVFSSNSFFSYGSGGYADYIFRFASRKLFGYEVDDVGGDDDDLPWMPVEQTTTTTSINRRRVVSARVAAVHKKRRDHHQVALYQHAKDGTFSCARQSPLDVPVLRFATAYGLQNIQRVLQSAPFSTTTSTGADLDFDYVEAMACPSGCPNGGGQIREANIRETPTETRERVSQTIQIMKSDRRDRGSCGDDGVHDALDSSYPYDLCPTGPFGEDAKRILHTRFHVVPPLQHTMGAAAGVDVKDTQW
jgi:iron only hydrogenase large subunit-like protein